MSLIVKAGKVGKRALKRLLPQAPCHLRYTRRLERVKTDRRVVAMTFDDGPMDLPASPDQFGGRSLTDVLLDILGEYGARGTFDVIGNTGENYPDRAGRTGQADWGGVRFDHYPDFEQDAYGGAVNNGRLMKRILQEGHQVTNHGYRHVIFGKKPFVYGKRAYLDGLDAAVEDQTRLHALVRERYGCEMTMGRPPHYVDRMSGGFSSYDVYDVMGYLYLAASYDGAGWLPSSRGTAEESLQAETEAMVEPMRRLLAENPDALCGQIIFQKDGYNMSRRTPVAFGLSRQLKLLKEYGYQVVTAAELMELCPFADVGRDDPLFPRLEALQRERAVVYSDNRLRLDQPMTWGELAMLLAPRAETVGRRVRRMKETGRALHAYWGAMDWCAEQGLIRPGTNPDRPVTALPDGRFGPAADFTRRQVYGAFLGPED